jgi:hypothetical protein
MKIFFLPSEISSFLLSPKICFTHNKKKMKKREKEVLQILFFFLNKIIKIKAVSQQQSFG